MSHIDEMEIGHAMLVVFVVEADNVLRNNTGHATRAISERDVPIISHVCITLSAIKGVGLRTVITVD